MIWLIALLYIYSPYLFLEMAAERGRDGKWHWPFHWAFVVLVFLLWPIVVPIAISAFRAKSGKGLTKS